MGGLAGAKTIVGGLVGGLALFLVGFIFWGTPLSAIAFSGVDDATSAQVQAALAQGLTQGGTGTYIIPSPATDQGTVLFGRGPIATVHFNASGFPVADAGAILSGLILALIAGIIIAIGLSFAGLRSFAERARLVVLLALGITLYIDLGQPIFNHYGWRYFIYSFLCDFIGFSVAGLVIARWFLPHTAVDATATRH